MLVASMAIKRVKVRRDASSDAAGAAMLSNTA
jgi:hypothetical protein